MGISALLADIFTAVSCQCQVQVTSVNSQSQVGNPSDSILIRLQIRKTACLTRAIDIFTSKVRTSRNSIEKV